MRRTIQIALTALYLLIFSHSILSAPVPTILALSSLPILTHPSDRDRLAVGINAHHISSQHQSPLSVLGFSYPPGRLYASDHHERKKEGHDTVKKKEVSYENRRLFGINVDHPSSKHEDPASGLAYSRPPGRLYDPKTRILGRLEAARLAASNFKVKEPFHDDRKPQLPGSPKPADLEGYGTEAPLHTSSSSSPHPDYDTMPSHDEELPSSWVLMHWRVSYGYINYSRLFTENIFEWALWLLGLAVIIAVGIEIHSVWNSLLEKIMEGAEERDGENESIADIDYNGQLKETKGDGRDWHEKQAKIMLKTTQYKYSQSIMGEGLDIDDDTDENGMEKSSW